MVVYEPTPSAKASAAFTVTVNEMPLAVTEFGDLHYCRFAMRGRVEIRVASIGRPVGAATLSPLSKAVGVDGADGQLKFALNKPGDFVLKAEGLPLLLIFADIPSDAPPAAGPALVDLGSLLSPGRNPSDPVTTELQAAIDKTAALRDGQGGTLYLPAGHYVSSQLRLKSNVHLHLASGALLQAEARFDPKRYPAQAGRDSSFIYIHNASNVRISGRGVIDGNGYAMRTLDPRANVKLLRAVETKNVVVEEILFQDSARWSFHILASQDVTLRGIKLVNDLRGERHVGGKAHIPLVTNTDGVDIDASSRVTVERSFFYTGDDAITPKVTGYMGKRGRCDQLTIRGNVFWTLKCALKVGDESLDDIGEIDFEDNDIVRADRAIALWSGDGGRIHDVRITNNRCEFIGGDFNERLFYFRVQLRRQDASKAGPIESVYVKDFFAHNSGEQASTIAGWDDVGRISKITFENVVINGRRVKSNNDIPLRVGKFTEAPQYVLRAEDER